MHWSDPTPPIADPGTTDSVRSGAARPTDADRPTDAARGTVVSGLIVSIVVRVLVGLVVAALAVLRLRSDALVVLAVLALTVGSVGLVRTRSARRPPGRDAVLVADGDALAPMLADATRRGDWHVIGAFGRCERPARARGVRWLGATDDVERFVTDRHVEVVLVASESMRDDTLRVALTRVRRRGVDVVIDAGLRGLDHRRLRPVGSRDDGWLSLRRERYRSVRATAKRSLDVLVASSALVLLAPLMLVIAVSVKAADGGPVLFSQWRVGRDGRLFSMRKFRTMVVDAERRLDALDDRNERQGGPLFKLDNDPRVTRVGRYLRAASLDELPQLFHVLGGSMSLVGPRPALPAEVAEFDARLGSRHDVRPGITGLWQVEARDDASFDAYRRRDVYYVENWSLGLDLNILARTLPAVVERGWRAVRGRRAPGALRPSEAGRARAGAPGAWIGVGHAR